jgi:hypothetical protein
MKYDFNAKTERRKGARLGSEVSWLRNAYRLVNRSCMAKIFFASLRLRAFLSDIALAAGDALKSCCLSKWAPFSFCLVVVISPGCVSQKKEQMEARRAFEAGQQQAVAAARSARLDQGPAVFVQGQVRNAAVPWEEGMKLSQAIVAAEYTAFMNPRLVRVIRNGQVAGEFKGIDLLHHADMELENGDTVLIIP